MSVLPSDYFPNMTADATGITIPYTDLAGLTQAEADPSTGDVREVLRNIVESFEASRQTRLAAQQTVPTRMVLTKPNPTGVGVNQIRQPYNMSFDIQISPANVSMIEE